MTTRRVFLGQVAAGSGVILLPRSLTRLGSSVTAANLFPAIDEDALRRFAVAAIEAARAAGASYADVRVTAGQQFQVHSSWSGGGARPLAPYMSLPSARLGVGIGVRALVDGAWGFAGNDGVTEGMAVECGRTATGFARGNRRRSEPPIVLAAGGATTRGEWSTPIEQDPFSVPIAEQAQLQLEALAGAIHLSGLQKGGVGFSWRRRTQVFASTDGALLTQRFVDANPSVGFEAHARGPSGVVGVGSAEADELASGGYGWETVHANDFARIVRGTAERAIEEARARALPVKDAEVGRYDVVFSAEAMAALLGATVGPALDLERALGFRANQAGTSFLAPPADLVGQYAVAAPAVTIRADRTRRGGFATVAWDDEGTPASETTLVERGVVVDYLTSRETAGELASWYEGRRQPVRSNGACRGAALFAPAVCLPNLTLEGAASGPSTADLIANTKRGFYVEFAHGSADQQLASNQFAIGSGAVREIRQGKLGSPIGDFGVQFITPVFWKNIEALGRAAEARDHLTLADRRALEMMSGNPLHSLLATIRAVPARVRDVNILNVGRTA